MVRSPYPSIPFSSLMVWSPGKWIPRIPNSPDGMVLCSCSCAGTIRHVADYNAWTAAGTRPYHQGRRHMRSKASNPYTNPRSVMEVLKKGHITS